MDDTLLLKEKWDSLRSEQPGLRIRAAASVIGVSELELLITQLGREVTILRPEFNEILRRAGGLGYVMALTRNDDCVMERKGYYANGILDKALVGVFVGEAIDLRIFFNHWAYAFASMEQTEDRLKCSLQFFSKEGEAMHKIFLNDKSNVEHFHLLVDEFKSPSQQWEGIIAPKPEKEAEISDALIDVEGFRHEWISLRDTHEFFPMIYKYNLTRTQALRLAPVGGYAVRVEEKTLRNVLKDAVKTQLPIMIFVANKGALQIFTGRINSLVDHNEWLNVLDPEFNLHLIESSIDQCWIVRKPTLDGFVTSVECFNSHGEQILQVFGKRKPGVEELQEWRKLVEVYG